MNYKSLYREQPSNGLQNGWLGVFQVKQARVGGPDVGNSFTLISC